MGQYFKAYSPARNSIADIDCANDMDDMTEGQLNSEFDRVEALMDAEFGEYVFVGCYSIAIYRVDNGDIEIKDCDRVLQMTVWGE